MKKTLIILSFMIVMGIMVFAACNMENTRVTAESEKPAKMETETVMPKGNATPVLVELFTSEGCSSCPSADRVLAKLQKEQPVANAEVITLAFHVDYWNYLGWKDEFSSKSYSERQGGYSGRFDLDSIYTPQMVIDGASQFVGSNWNNAVNEIKKATSHEKTSVDISFAEAAKNTNVKVKISDLPAHDESYIWLATTEDNLTTNVKRGENGGKTLPHTGVVRDMKLIGNFVPNEKNFETEAAVNIKSDWKKKDLKFVVFVQGKSSKKIFALDQKKMS